MKKILKEFVKRKEVKISVIVIAVLLIALVSFFVYRYLFTAKESNFVIENKYYDFSLKTPRGWIAKQNMSYSEEDISKVLQQCADDTGSVSNTSYEVGVFKFEDQKYPDDFGELGYFPDNAKSGAILEVKINCIPKNIKDKNIYDTSKLNVGGEIASQNYLNLVGFGKTKSFFLLHDNLQYQISEYIYISPQDKNKDEANIRDDYNNKFDKIISTFKFVK